MTSLSVPTSGSRATGDVICSHCGLPVPPALRREEDAEQFCCEGCRSVFGIINASGLEQYYAIRDVAPGDREAARTTNRRYEEFDAPEFRDRYCRAAGEGLTTVELALEGVHCSACLWLIEKLPRLVPGVAESRLEYGRRIVRIVWDDEAVGLSRVAQQLAALGYPPHPVTVDPRRAEQRRLLIHIAVAGALAGNVMLLSFALYGGAFHGIETRFFHLFRGASLGLTLLALLWPGRIFFRSAISALRARSAHMDIPIALGLTAGTIGSAWATVRGAGDVYFESVTALVFLLLVGRWFLMRQQRRSSDAVELLYSMTPRHAVKVVGDVDAGATQEVPMTSLASGDHVRVLAGETIPVDGTVARGASLVSAAWLTGESRGAAVEPGDNVQAGSVNLDAPLTISVTAAGTETGAGRLMQLVERCAHERAPIVQVADRLAGVFVLIVIALACVTAGIWSALAPERALANALALLIITCPCALGLATPLAIVAAIGRAASRGIMIKGGAVIEALARRDGTIYLDKTGTVTEGAMAVRAWHGEESVRNVVAQIERDCAHPVARALATMTDDTPECAIDDIVADPRGRAARVAGTTVTVGTATFLADRDIPICDWAASTAAAVTAGMQSPVFVARDGQVVAIAAVGDAVRPGAAEAVSTLHRAGWRVALLSGDHPDLVRATGAAIGIAVDDCHGGVRPEEKVAIVKDASPEDTIVMVGDGVNDAAALAAATVGVAVRGGAEASLATADVYLAQSGIAALPQLMHGASRTLGAIKRGLAVSLGYNVVGVSLAMAGLMNPIVAAVLMPISSLTVVTLAFRARTFQGPRCR